jgi:hypothetical protein
MISVTEKATAALNDTLNANLKGKSSKLLRLVSSEAGFGLNLDEEREGDQVVKHEDRPVLVIESSVAESFDGAVVDAVDSPEGRKIVIQPPA